MKIEVVADEGALAKRAAELVCLAVRDNPATVFGLPTGTTVISTYFELSRLVDRGEVDFREATAFAIDEFLGPQRMTPGTNSYFFRQYLRVPFKALHIPNSAAPDPDEHIVAFTEAVKRAGGIDLCVLGIGRNGHVAFNEPGSKRDSRARVVELAPETREAHATTFGSMAAVPSRGLTLGIAEIMESRRLLVLAYGDAKADIVASAIEGPQTADLPASWLQDHAGATWLLDEQAASRLAKQETREEEPGT